SLSAAVAAGILAIGDEHGGAGSACMEVIAAGVTIARKESVLIPEAARRLLEQAQKDKKRLPGLGHRVHTHDPRTGVLFGLAREVGLAGDGMALTRARE